MKIYSCFKQKKNLRFIYLLMFVYFLRDRQSTSRGGAEGKGDRIWSRLQVGLEPTNDLSWSLMLNRLSHPGAPEKLKQYSKSYLLRTKKNPNQNTTKKTNKQKTKTLVAMQLRSNEPRSSDKIRSLCILYNKIFP